MDVFYLMRYIFRHIDGIKNPLGTQDIPARTCRDLIGCHRGMTTGKKFIAPGFQDFL